MHLKLILSPIDKAALLVVAGFVLFTLLGYLSGSAKFTRAFGLLSVFSVGVITALSFYVHFRSK